MNVQTADRTTDMHTNHNSSTKLVSIIVPVFNTERYLERCLESLVRQTYQNIEVILIDDGSTDGSGSTCDQYAASDKRVRVEHRTNRGASVARNLGLRKAKGSYITFADSDDWLEPDAIDNMVNLLENENVDCIRTTMYRNSTKGESISKSFLVEGKYTKDNLSEVLKPFASGEEQCYVYLLMFKKSLLSKLKPFNEQVHMMEDTCFYMDLFVNVNSIYISDIRTYHYFESEGSVTRSPERYVKNLNDILEVNSEIKKMLSKAGLLKGDIRESLDIEHVRLMSEYAYLAYENEPGAMARIVGTLRHDKGFRDLVSGIDLSRLTVGHRYAVKYLLSEDDTKLGWLFGLRHVVDLSRDLSRRIALQNIRVLVKAQENSDA